MTKRKKHIDQNLASSTYYYKRSILLLVVSIFSFTTTFSQSIPQQMQSYVVKLHSSQAQVPASFKEEKNAKEVIESASEYFGDSLTQVRSRLYALVGETGSASKNGEVRGLAVEKLVNATNDLNSLDMILNQLSNFGKNDFSESSMESLVALFRQRPPYFCKSSIV